MLSVRDKANDWSMDDGWTIYTHVYLSIYLFIYLSFYVVIGCVSYFTRRNDNMVKCYHAISKIHTEEYVFCTCHVISHDITCISVIAPSLQLHSSNNDRWSVYWTWQRGMHCGCNGELWCETIYVYMYIYVYNICI